MAAMDDWTLYDSTGPVRSGLDEDTARELVDWNHDNGNTGVYASSSNGQRYPEGPA